MTRFWSTAAVWFTAVGVAGAGLTVLPAATKDRDPAASAAARPTEQVVATKSRVDVDSIWRAAPFRAGRVPADKRYSSEEAMGAEAPPPEAPQWRIAGVVSSGVRLALVEELPGQRDATYLVSAGDNVGPYLVSLITADSVVVEARGARWTLKVEAPW